MDILLVLLGASSNPATNVLWKHYEQGGERSYTPPFKHSQPAPWTQPAERGLLPASINEQSPLEPDPPPTTPASRAGVQQ